MAWQKGPLPKDTYGWGGVVPLGLGGSGFYFADFQGDKVEAVISQGRGKILKPEEVAWYDNSLTLPPECPKGAKRLT